MYEKEVSMSDESVHESGMRTQRRTSRALLSVGSLQESGSSVEARPQRDTAIKPAFTHTHSARFDLANMSEMFSYQPFFRSTGPRDLIA